MSEAATIEAPAAAAPAAPAPAAPTTAPAPESLLHTDAPATPAAPTDPAAEAFAFADKVLVKAADGAVDYEATARKAEQARQHLEKRLGSGDAPPKDVTGYEFTAPEDLKAFELKGERVEAFKAEALKHGVTPAQFAWMMDSYLKAVPDLMEGAAKMTAAQARAELGKTWATQGEFDAGLAAAQTATRALPPDLQEAAKGYGTDPTFVRLMAWVGQQMREDRPPSTVATPTAQSDVMALQMNPAYRDPKHPDHARITAQVQAFFKAQPGADQPL